MCLATKQRDPFIAQEDLIVYKDLKTLMTNVYVESPFQYKMYVIGQLYKTDIVQTNDDSFYDSNDQQAAREDELKGLVKFFGPGFHTALHKERFTEYPSCNFLDIKVWGEIYECTIPKGSLYYVGYTDLVVSNQIIINKLA